MALDFTAKIILHKLQVKFIHAFLPEAKKPFYLKPVHQPALDIHGIASMGEAYNITTPAKVIEEGLTAGIDLIKYLTADGYIIKTSLFNLKMRVPGEYSGSETHLPEGVYPVVRLQTAGEFRKYVRENVNVEFDGVDESDGLIAEATDEATGLVDEVATMGNILTIRGHGLKIETDEAHKAQMGVFFKPAAGIPIKATIVAVNEHRTLKVLVPAELIPDTAYQITVQTMSSSRGGGGLLKNPRDMRSDFMVTATR